MLNPPHNFVDNAENSLLSTTAIFANSGTTILAKVYTIATTAESAVLAKV
jgi:hypothetical protein